jgi:hypothetical protein
MERRTHLAQQSPADAGATHREFLTTAAAGPRVLVNHVEQLQHAIDAGVASSPSLPGPHE